MKLPKNKLLIFIVSLTLPFIAGAVGSAFTYSAIPTWYMMLSKPSFSPPNWIFGPVWTILYLLMGVSFYLVLVSKKSRKKSQVISVFLGQLVLNSFWSVAFFGLRSPVFGVIIIVPLWILILTMIKRFLKVDKTAGLINIPYILWVSFASILNIAIAILN